MVKTIGGTSGIPKLASPKETVLLLDPPVGHLRFFKGTLVKPMGNNVFARRSVSGPVESGAPSDHKTRLNEIPYKPNGKQ